MFEQADDGQNVLAHLTPNRHGLQMMKDSLQANEDNGVDHDVRAARAVYWGHNWNLAVAHAVVDKAAGIMVLMNAMARDGT